MNKNPATVTRAMPSGVENGSLSRRDFLQVATWAILVVSGLLGLGALIRFLGYTSEEQSQTDFDLGPAWQYPLGSRTPLPEVPAMLLHTNEGFVALSLVCTHLGCTLQPQTESFICPCHGSVFEAGGDLKKGPARRPLQSLRVDQTPDGHLHVYKDPES
jgi:cytochrome b6-f complex iron-sulfur subunit